MSRKINWEAMKTAARTAGALMCGNAFVGHFVLGQTDFIKLGILLVAGFAVIIGASLEKGENRG